MIKKVHCPHCSKEVVVNSKGRLVPHLVHKGKKCVFSGQPANKMEILSEGVKKGFDELHKEKNIKKVE